MTRLQKQSEIDIDPIRDKIARKLARALDPYADFGTKDILTRELAFIAYENPSRSNEVLEALGKFKSSVTALHVNEITRRAEKNRESVFNPIPVHASGPYSLLAPIEQPKIRTVLAKAAQQQDLQAPIEIEQTADTPQEQIAPKTFEEMTVPEKINHLVMQATSKAAVILHKKHFPPANTIVDALFKIAFEDDFHAPLIIEKLPKIHSPLVADRITKIAIKYPQYTPQAIHALERVRTQTAIKKMGALTRADMQYKNIAIGALQRLRAAGFFIAEREIAYIRRAEHTTKNNAEFARHTVRLVSREVTEADIARFSKDIPANLRDEIARINIRVEDKQPLLNPSTTLRAYIYEQSSLARQNEQTTAAVLENLAGIKNLIAIEEIGRIARTHPKYTANAMHSLKNINTAGAVMKIIALATELRQSRSHIQLAFDIVRDMSATIKMAEKYLPRLQRLLEQNQDITPEGPRPSL